MRNPAERLNDIVVAVTDAAELVARGHSEFIADPLLIRAAKNILAEIGEAAKGIDDDTLSTMPGVPWKNVKGMRDKVVHDYSDIDLMWETLVHELPRVGEAIAGSTPIDHPTGCYHFRPSLTGEARDIFGSDPRLLVRGRYLQSRSLITKCDNATLKAWPGGTLVAHLQRVSARLATGSSASPTHHNLRSWQFPIFTPDNSQTQGYALAMSELIGRRAESLIAEALTGFRVVIVNGPRQTGKSTLLELSARNAGSLVTLDDRDVLRVARTDPRGLVEGYARPLLIDEVQRGGEPLVLAIKAAVDRAPREMGAFVLAGSSRFLTVPGLTESLAGRARIIDLWPLTQGEISAGADNFIDLAFGPTNDLRLTSPVFLTRPEVMSRITMGGFPAVQSLPTRRLRSAWFEDYLRTLVTRDLTLLSAIRKLDDLPRLVQLLAARTAQELNVASLARDAGINGETLRSYLAPLETIYLHLRLPAWSTNFTSRAKHHPKVHMVDTGLAANVLGLTAERLSTPTTQMAGPLFETFVVNELVRQQAWSDERVRLGHFRDREQREVDLIMEAGDGRVVAVEMKAARDVDETDFRWLAYLRDRLGDRFVNGIVIHLGERPLPFGDRLTALPVSAVWS